MSLSAEVIKLYKQGHIRDSVIDHAVKEASKVRKVNDFIKSANLASKRAEIFGAVTPTLVKIARGDPMEISKRMGPIGKAIAGLATIGAVAELGNKMIMGYRHNKTYEQMMQQNPEFASKQDLVKKHFDILKQFSPVLATNPTIAAGHVRQALEMGDIVPTDTIKNLAQTQKAYRESRGNTLTTLPGDVLGALTGSLGNLVTGTDIIG